jgi:ubiquinone/menaquinone biosynthesis methyltransferase
MTAPKKPDLIENLSTKEKKREYTAYIFDKIYHRYDFITVFLSYGMDKGWKRKLVKLTALQGRERVLDLACGTGDITFAMAQELNTGEAIGLDITHGMLQLANRKRDELKAHNTSFERGDIMRLPHPDNSFDVVTGGYALRNVPDLTGALDEIYRVLKPGGKFFSLDFGHPQNKLYDWAYLQYLTVVGSLSGIVIHGDADTYRYIPETLKRYPGQRGVQKMMQNAGFADCGFYEFMGGIMAINYGRKA